MSDSEVRYLSRTALAETLNITLKELTELMVDSGWVVQQGKAWQLTAKGEFEGGMYRDSHKYGRYIVWPASILEHPMIVDAQERRVSVSVLAKDTLLSPRLFNRLLAELGWIQPFGKGWQLTELGELFQGQQYHNEENGSAYVMWPRTLVDQEGLKQALAHFDESANSPALESCLDGRRVDSFEHRLIANWLYLLNINCAYKRVLFLTYNDAICPDFYIPQYRLCIDYWAEQDDPAQLAERLHRRELYQRYTIKAIELTPEQLKDLDQALPRQLQKWGVVTY